MTQAPALVAGAFVVLCGAAADAADPAALARQLLEDGGWAECRRECARVRMTHPGHPALADMDAAAARKMQAAPPGATQGSAASAPGRAMVWIYRSMVRPAIGARCSLDPSCSEYFLQSSRRHGLLGFPMMADRLVREPSEVRAHPVPVPPGSEVRVPDPVSDHDFWMRPRCRASDPCRKPTP
ncbi:MAG: membrane protein insertion efficiency factor YidD [Verrucomicrobia bacterium]|nr:membrane protein insertion efficiency factor YidD [Verrucomicrobiota bacterium]